MQKKYKAMAVLLLVLGMLGVVLNRRHVIIMLMSIELILLAASFLFLINSMVTDGIIGQVFTIMVFTVAAAESSIGLAIMVAYFRIKGTITIKSLNWLKG